MKTQCISSGNQVLLILHLNIEQALYLKDMVQNPISEDESEPVEDFRESVFNSLTEVGI